MDILGKRDEACYNPKTGMLAKVRSSEDTIINTAKSMDSAVGEFEVIKKFIKRRY